MIKTCTSFVKKHVYPILGFTSNILITKIYVIVFQSLFLAWTNSSMNPSWSALATPHERLWGELYTIVFNSVCISLSLSLSLGWFLSQVHGKCPSILIRRFSVRLRFSGKLTRRLQQISLSICHVHLHLRRACWHPSSGRFQSLVDPLQMPNWLTSSTK